MVNRFNGVLKLHTAAPDSKVGWVGIPWAILLSSFLVNILISVIVGGKVAIYTGGLSSIFIYMLIACIIGVNSTFPFALGLCIRRTDYFLGTSLVFLVLSLGNAVLLCLLSFVESDLTDNWGTQLHFFNLPFISDGGLISQFVILFLAMLHLCFLGFGMSSIYHRFGMSGIYLFSGILLLPLSVIGFLANYFGWWDNIFRWIGEQGSLGVVLWLTPLTLFYAFLSYRLLQRATV